MKPLLLALAFAPIFNSSPPPPPATTPGGGGHISKIAMLKPITMPDLQPVEPLELVYLNKLRPSGTFASSDTYAPGNCTWYVASRLPVPQTWGNANTWAYYASKGGYTVSAVPKVGSIAQNSWMSNLGHVAIVEAVSATSVTVSEMNVQGLGVVDIATYPISSWAYIYV